MVVPHQANLRIIDATARRMGIDNKKIMINIKNTEIQQLRLYPCVVGMGEKMKKEII